MSEAPGAKEISYDERIQQLVSSLDLMAAVRFFIRHRNPDDAMFGDHPLCKEAYGLVLESGMNLQEAKEIWARIIRSFFSEALGDFKKGQEKLADTCCKIIQQYVAENPEEKEAVLSFFVSNTSVDDLLNRQDESPFKEIIDLLNAAESSIVNAQKALDLICSKMSSEEL